MTPRTRLAYKAEHVIDLKTEAILEAEIDHANAADTATLVPSLEQAQEHLDEASGLTADIKKVVADKGDHAASTLDRCGDVGCFGMKTDIPEPRRKTEGDWESRSKSEQRAVTNNRHRTQRDYGKRLQRGRSEVVERSFAHICETGGGRRSWLRGLDEVRKRHLMAAMAHNLGLVLRKLLGSGKVREFAALGARAWAFVCALLRRLGALTRLIASFGHFVAHSPTKSTTNFLAV